MRFKQRVTAMGIALILSSCGGDAHPPSAAGSGSAPDRSAAAGDDGGIVIRVRDGGQHPDRFCMPQWSIANRSGTDIGALLVDLEWRTRDGKVLQAAGEFGSLIEPFGAGREKDLSLNGYTAACADLVLQVGRYACRDASAVRIPCPAALRAESPGTVGVDLSVAREASMRGAVEPAAQRPE